MSRQPSSESNDEAGVRVTSWSASDDSARRPYVAAQREELGITTVREYEAATRDTTFASSMALAETSALHAVSGTPVESVAHRTYRFLEEFASEGHGDEVGAYIQYFAMTVRPESIEDLHAWYREEHAPMLLDVPGWNRITRYELVDGDGPQFLAVHQLESLAVLDHPLRAKASHTPWLKKTIEYTVTKERGFFRLRDE